MRIVEIVDTLEFGGTERLVVDLARSLQALGHRLQVVCLRRTGPLARHLDEGDIPVVALDKPPGPNVRALKDLVTFLRSNRIEVVHTHNPLVHHYGLASGRLAGVPVVVNTIHGIRNLSNKIGAKEILYSLACRFSDRIVAVCPMAHRAFAEGRVIPSSKLITINNGIRLEPFLQVTPRRVRDDFVFGIVGRLEPVKDHRSLLRAFGIVLQQHECCRLEILGDGPERANLEQLARDSGIAPRVLFRGFSNNVAQFLQGIDAAVLCSTSEALPLGVLEAMGAARPVIGTAVGGVPDLIGNGACGWLCPPAKPALLAAAMSKAVSSSSQEREEMGSRGRAHAAAEYSLQRMTSEYERLFQLLLAA
jgi:glycosyltransferase involved in cell wall biosynthesis